jgi:hypothetical protein
VTRLRDEEESEEDGLLLRPRSAYTGASLRARWAPPNQVTRLRDEEETEENGVRRRL